MYQIWDITTGQSKFIRSANEESNAIELADSLRQQWKVDGMQDRHFKVTYTGLEVYRN